jgi:hypothetical protein
VGGGTWIVECGIGIIILVLLLSPVKFFALKSDTIRHTHHTPYTIHHTPYLTNCVASLFLFLFSLSLNLVPASSALLQAAGQRGLFTASGHSSGMKRVYSGNGGQDEGQDEGRSTSYNYHREHGGEHYGDYSEGGLKTFENTHESIPPQQPQQHPPPQQPPREQQHNPHYPQSRQPRSPQRSSSNAASSFGASLGGVSFARRQTQPTQPTQPTQSMQEQPVSVRAHDSTWGGFAHSEHTPSKRVSVHSINQPINQTAPRSEPAGGVRGGGVGGGGPRRLDFSGSLDDSNVGRASLYGTPPRQLSGRGAHIY